MPNFLNRRILLLVEGRRHLWLAVVLPIHRHRPSPVKTQEKVKDTDRRPARGGAVVAFEAPWTPLLIDIIEANRTVRQPIN